MAAWNVFSTLGHLREGRPQPPSHRIFPGFLDALESPDRLRGRLDHTGGHGFPLVNPALPGSCR